MKKRRIFTNTIILTRTKAASAVNAANAARKNPATNLNAPAAS